MGYFSPPEQGDPKRVNGGVEVRRQQVAVAPVGEEEDVEDQVPHGVVWEFRVFFRCICPKTQLTHRTLQRRALTNEMSKG